MIVQDTLRGFLDAVYPPICLLCGRLSHGLFPHCCLDCFELFEPVGAQCCELCGKPFQVSQVHHLCLVCIKGRPPFKWCRGVYLYRGAVAEALSRFKYGGMIGLLAPLEEALATGIGTLHPFPEVDLLIPVPLSLNGRLKRGFNQSYVLAASAARQLGVEVQTDALRKKGNRTQVGLSSKERSRNAAVSFVPGRAIDLVRGQRVLLFDDVYTTGSTVRACARILRSAGSTVSVLTLARAVFPFGVGLSD
jgi:ComF family protein